MSFRLAFAAFSLMFFASASAQAQQALKDRLIGTWTLVSFDNTAADGTKREILGPKPNGIIVFDADGNYVVLSIKADRPKWKSRNRLEASQEELASAALGMITLFGMWSANDGDSSITRHIIGSSVPNNEGADFKSGVRFGDGTLTVIDGNAAVGGRVEATYKRAK